MAKKIDELKIVRSAIKKGIDALTHDYPLFMDNKEFILKHIDEDKLRSKVEEVYGGINDKNWSKEKKAQYIHESIANYVASGKAFDNEGEKRVLRKDLEAKARSGFFRGRLARRELKGERNLDKTLAGWRSFYEVVEKKGLSEEIPAVYKAMRRIRGLGILRPAIEALRDENIINDKEYRRYQERFREEIIESGNYAKRSLEEYITPQKEAAAVFLVLGIVLMVFSGLKFTGAVINALNLGTSLVGILFLIFGLLLFFMRFKKK